MPVEGGLCLVEACPRLVVPVDGWTGALPGLFEVFDGSLAARLGGSDLVASGPSPAPARRVETALCVGVLPPRLISSSRGSGE